MIFSTTLEAIRQGIRESELRMNLLRICARAPRTIHDLIHAPTYPGIEMSLFSLQSEINVTVELGEGKNRGLLVQVGKAPDPVVPGGQTELLRTSLLAFLVCPELACAEPQAYGIYLDSWFGLPEVRENLGKQVESLKPLFWAFPELAHRSFYVAAPGVLPQDEYFRGDPRKVFGCYFIEDIPVHPRPGGWRALWRALAMPPLEPGQQALRDRGLPLEHPLWLAALVALSRLRRARPGHGEYFAFPLRGPELLAGRLRPLAPWASQKSFTRSPSNTVPPRRHRASRQESASSREIGSETS